MTWLLFVVWILFTSTLPGRREKHFEEAYWRRTLSSYSDASGVGTALPPPNIAVELQTGNC
jgi:hypothetical protein